VGWRVIMMLARRKESKRSGAGAAGRGGPTAALCIEKKVRHN